MSHFHDEIRQQPAVLAGLLEDGSFRATADSIRLRAPDNIATLGRGSSGNAAAFFAYLAGSVLRLPAAALPLSLYSVHGVAPLAGSTLAVGVSQSGRSEDVVAAVKALGAGGAATLGVSNDPDSSLASASDWHLHQNAGVEKAVAATKTMSSQMFALALLVAHWSGDGALLDALEQVPAAMEAMFSEPGAGVAAAARGLESARGAWLLGRGLNQAVAAETALKLKETSYLQTHTYSSAEVLHGPVAAVEPGTKVLLFALEDATLESNLKTARRMLEHGAELTVISSAGQLLELAGTPVELPAGHHPATASFVQLAAGQLLVEQLANLRGLDPDQPRHLSKVTLTV